MSGGANINFPAMARGVYRLLVQAMKNPSPTPQTFSCSTPGNIGQPPFSNRGGLVKLFFVCSSSLYIGGLIAHKGASFLEENEIFVPAEDDDDD